MRFSDHHDPLELVDLVVHFRAVLGHMAFLHATEALDLQYLEVVLHFYQIPKLVSKL
jgi:hypothetical protein